MLKSAKRQLGRQIAVEFAKNLVIQNNIFDVSDGEFKNNSNDGETINSEGAKAAHILNYSKMQGQ
jgi:hypothetical protein